MPRRSRPPQRRAPVPSPVPVALEIEGAPVELRLRVSDRARRLALRVAPRDGAVELVVPRAVSHARALEFARAHADWIRRRHEARLPALPLVDGAVLPLAGTPHRIRHRPGLRGTVWRAAGPDGAPELNVAGEAAHLPRRLRDWLRAEARRLVTPLALAKAARIGRPVRRIAIGDPRTRWASCSASGTLSFSWRLALTPPFVLDYIVAHEVAHLVEMNHSPRFWKLAAALAEGGDIAPARAWLLANGPRLLAVGG